MQRKVGRLARQIQIAAVVLCLLILERTMGQAAPPPLTAPGRTQNTIGMMSIGTAASGVVKDVLVHEGSRVHAGQIMVTLSCGPLEAEAKARDAHSCGRHRLFSTGFAMGLGPRKLRWVRPSSVIHRLVPRRQRKRTDEPGLCVKALALRQHIYWRRYVTLEFRQLSLEKPKRSSSCFWRDRVRRI